MSDIDLKRKKLSRWVAIGITAASVVLLMPAIMMLVKGLIGIAVAGVVSLAIVNFAPVISIKFATWKIKAIVADAKANPIETMIDVANERADKLNEAKQRIGELSAAVKNFADKVVGFKKTWPNEAAAFDMAVDNANKVLDKWKKDWSTANTALSIYLTEIDKCKAVNEMALEMAKLNNMTKMDSDKLMEKLRSDTAIDEVSKRMNSAMAQLETSLLEEVKFELPAVGNNKVSALADDTPSTGRELNMQLGLKQKV